MHEEFIPDSSSCFFVPSRLRGDLLLSSAQEILPTTLQKIVDSLFDHLYIAFNRKEVTSAMAAKKAAKKSTKKTTKKTTKKK